MKILNSIPPLLILMLFMTFFSGCSMLNKTSDQAVPNKTAQKAAKHTTVTKSHKNIYRTTHYTNNVFNKAVRSIKASAGKNVLVITNAGYGSLDGNSSESMIDEISAGTGCTPGQKSLLTVHTPYYEPFWATVINTDTFNSCFIKSSGKNFVKTNLNLSPKVILTPAGWSTAHKTAAGNRLFSIVSIALAANADANWNMLRAAELHDHFCPGLNAGFIVQAYMEKTFPLSNGDKYVFVGAPPMCALDALQSLDGATAGKKGVFSMNVANMVNGAIARNGVKPVIIAMRVNSSQNRTDGAILGFDFDRISSFTGIKSSDLKPEGGPSNPLFYISRIKSSVKMVQMPMKNKMDCLEIIKKFSGPASKAIEVENAKSNPYAPLILSSY